MILSTHGIVGSQMTQFVGLLDTYSGAAAAYSLRKLRTDYTGSAITVRNSSNSEADIGFVNNVLDTASLLTHCGAGNGFVTKWYDQSGNSNNVTQTNVLYQPQIVNSGVIILQGTKPTLSFDGTNDSLYGVFGTTITQANTTFIATTMPSLLYGFIYDSNSPNRQTLLRNANFNSIEFFCGSSITSSNGTTIGGSDYLFVSNANSSLSYVYANNSLIASGNSGSNSISSLYIGQGNFGLGNNGNIKIRELIFYSSDQSSNRTAIQNNINSFYSIY